MCRALAAELKSWFQNQKFDRSLELDHAFLERCRAMNARQFTSQIGRDFAAKYKRSREFKQAASSAPTSLRGEKKYIYIYLYSYIWYTNYMSLQNPTLQIEDRSVAEVNFLRPFLEGAINGTPSTARWAPQNPVTVGI
jgi:hypothetical protein